MTRRKKWAIGCAVSLLPGAWGLLSLLGLAGWSLTYYEVSEFRRSDPAGGLGPVGGVTVYCGMRPKTNVEYMWGFPFVTFANDTDTHYINVHFESTKAEHQPSAKILDAELVTSDTRIHVPLVLAPDDGPLVDGEWAPLRRNHNWPSYEYATFYVPDGVHIPRAESVLHVVVRFCIRRNSQESSGVLETRFVRFSATRPPYVSHPHAW